MKKAQGMPFALIFALIIGGVILFLAIFFSGKMLGTGTYQKEAELTRSLDILFNPMSSIRQEGVTISRYYSLPEKANISFKCDAEKDSQTISILLEKGKKPFAYAMQNKYIFSRSFDTKNLWIFGKPFEMPWRVDDMIFVVSRNYCFDSQNMPAGIKDELSALNSSFIKITTAAMISSKKCSGITVCFEKSGCDINVKYTLKEVRLRGKLAASFLDDSTMYALIFDPEEYDCNLKRLMKRLDFQADILLEKASILESRGCYEAGGMRQELLGMKTAIANKDYLNIQSYAANLKSKNIASCELY